MRFAELDGRHDRRVRTLVRSPIRALLVTRSCRAASTVRPMPSPGLAAGPPTTAPVRSRAAMLPASRQLRRSARGCPRALAAELTPTSRRDSSERFIRRDEAPRETIASLRTRGLALGSSELGSALPSTSARSVPRRFDAVVTSAEAAWQPDPAIFLLALERLGFAGTRAHVGDEDVGRRAPSRPGCGLLPAPLRLRSRCCDPPGAWLTLVGVVARSATHRVQQLKPPRTRSSCTHAVSESCSSGHLALVLANRKRYDPRDTFALRRPESWRRALLLSVGVLRRWLLTLTIDPFLQPGSEQGRRRRWHRGARASSRRTSSVRLVGRWSRS